MRIFIFSKKSLIFNFSIICIIILILLSSLSLATEFHSSSTLSDNIINNINDLVKGKEKIAYLTFDDGPSLVTPKILDILSKENVKASFFVIGKSVEAHPEIVKRAYDEGHYIANHTYSHNLAIGKAIGVENYSSLIFRFPNGFMSPQYKAKKKEATLVLSQMNYCYIDWNCLNNDSVKKYTSSQLLSNLKQSSKNKGTLVILMHDTKDVSNSSLALEASIEYLKSEGYSFRNFYSIVNNLK